ncbi:aminotransferase class IV [Desulfosoma sp.]
MTCTESTMPKTRFVWWNGSLVPEESVRVSPFDRGFLFGDGLFETLRADEGRALYVSDHLERLREGAIRLRLLPPGDGGASALDLNAPSVWAQRISQLLQANGLQSGSARVKIVVSRGDVSGVGLPAPKVPTVCVLAEPYTPPSQEAYARGWTLRTFRAGCTPPLAAMKTLNYLFYLWARQDAADAGFDEALLYDPLGHAAETATGSLLFLHEGRCTVSASPQRLRGTAERRILALFREDGWAVEEAAIPETRLFSFSAVWVTNSLVGIMPVRSIDGTALPRLFDAQAARYRDRFFRP